MANKSGMDYAYDFARNAQALKDIIKAAMRGGWHAAAIEVIKHYGPQILMAAVVILLLPVIIFCCLPAMLFGFGSSVDPEISAMNRQAEMVQQYYRKYQDYCDVRIQKIESYVKSGGSHDDTVHQAPESNEKYSIQVKGGPMETNWFISLHSVRNGNDLNNMTEESITEFVEDSILYTVEDIQPDSKPSESENQGTSSEGTSHEAPETNDSPPSPDENKSTAEKKLTIRYLTPEEFMNEYHYSDEDRNWAQLMHRTLEDNGVSGGSNDIVEVAASQIGNIGGEIYWKWYGFDTYVEWCACFVSWAADQCGYIDAGIIPKFAACDVGWFRDKGQFQDRNYIPNPGDLIFFDWASDGQDGKEDHVGIVEKCDGQTVYTIEGNTNGGSGEVARHQYPVGYYEIYGYCPPAYPRLENSNKN